MSWTEYIKCGFRSLQCSLYWIDNNLVLEQSGSRTSLHLVPSAARVPDNPE